MQEAIHRNKNLVAVIQSMALMTRPEDPARFRADFGARLQALSASHDLMLLEDQKSVRLADLIRLQVDHFLDNEGRLKMTGPDLRIASRVAQTLGMALHELATNAVKYGALCCKHGCVRLEWTISGDGERFQMAWIERDGPPAVEPSREGFGTRVLRDIVRASLGGAVSLDFSPRGLTWRLECPAEKVVESGLRLSAWRPCGTAETREH